MSPPPLGVLSASRAQRAAVVRWLRPLVPVVMIVVIWAAFDADPRPGTGGRDLRLDRARRVRPGRAGRAVDAPASRGAHVAWVVALLATSVALVWLQPDGAGVAGIFVGVSLLAPLVQKHLSVPVMVAALVVLSVVVTIGRHGSVTSALLDAIMVGAFYGMTFLAMRLGEANELAERLFVKVEQSRAAQTRAAGLAERQRLAREMHDVLAHSLSGLMLQLEGARLLAAADAADPRLPLAIDRAHQLGKTGLDEARRAIGMLREDELPGPERLAGLAAQFEQDRSVPCRLTVSGEPYPLAPEARVAVYRVVQEALTNITKHADPERVELHLAYAPSATRLTVEDFATPDDRRQLQSGDGNGYGLTGMRERAELLGGTLTAQATRGGFRVELDVPA